MARYSRMGHSNLFLYPTTRGRMNGPMAITWGALASHCPNSSHRPARLRCVLEACIWILNSLPSLTAIPRGLRPDSAVLEAGDLLVFYAGLRGYGCDIPPGLYLIGYFEIAFAGLARELTEEQIHACSNNFHVRHETIFRDQRERLVLVKDGTGSRLLTKAVKVNVLGKDRAGKPLKILSPEMQKIFGEFNGRLSLQRSPP
jgi:hypothetical protein